MVGALGLMLLARRRAAGAGAFAAVFAGVALTAFGSAYYHLAPNNAALFWDRAPMAVVFMAVFTLVLADRLGRGAEWLLLPLIFLGLGSVVYWRHSGDLRLYILVQYFPVLAILLLVALFPPRYPGTSLLPGVAGWYGAAKIFEVLDRWIFSLGGVVSGHTLKHVAAGLATYCILRFARDRQPLSSDVQELYIAGHSM